MSQALPDLNVSGHIESGIARPICERDTVSYGCGAQLMDWRCQDLQAKCAI